MNDGVRRTLTVLAAGGIMIGFMVLSWSWMAPAIAVDGETRFFLWEEGSGTALQVKLAFFGALLVAAPIYLLLLRLPWLRTPSVSDAASPSLRIPPFLWLGIGLVMTVAVIRLPLPGLPDLGGGRPDAPPLDWVWLFLLTVLLPTWVAVVLFAVAVGPRAAPAATGGTIALPTSALVVYLCLTLGFFHLFWGGTLRIAPIVHRDEVTVLTIETIGKPYKAGIVHWMFAEVSPWQGVDATQRLQILDRDWMDRLEIGQTIELGWASVWKVRVIKTIEAVDAPEPSIVAL